MGILFSRFGSLQPSLSSGCTGVEKQTSDRQRHIDKLTPEKDDVNQRRIGSSESCTHPPFE
jgi:hypothetical protein